MIIDDSKIKRIVNLLLILFCHLLIKYIREDKIIHEIRIIVQITIKTDNIFLKTYQTQYNMLKTNNK